MGDVSDQGRARGRWLSAVLALAVLAGFAAAGWWAAARLHGPAYHDRIAPWQPVVAALDRYVAEHGAPPAQLNDLVPQYLSAKELPPLPGPNYLPQPYTVTGSEYAIIISAGGWKDYLTYESQRPGWYYFDGSNAPERLVQPAAGP